jgi:ubiquinone/menaquinone biosynthesis C-methylase UbiE
MTHNDVLQRQIEYYRARAREYDEWFYRLGRYDHGEEYNRAWFQDVAALVERVGALGHQQKTLELAAGTGIWTKELVEISDQVVALDASPEVIAINREKVNSDRVTYQQVDLFQWMPDDTYDLVFMSFWMSHVPPEKLDTFLEQVRQATKIGGRVFMIDSLAAENSSAKNHATFEQHSLYHTRKLNDGREFEIVKVFYDLSQLHERLTAHGFKAETGKTDQFFWWADAVRIR